MSAVESVHAVDPLRLREQLDSLFAYPDLLPERLLSFMVDYLSINQPQIPISNVFGFSQFTANAHSVSASEASSASGSYLDLTTVGPTVSGLASGRYLVVFGANASSGSASNVAYAALSVNSSTPDDGQACYWDNANSGFAGQVWAQLVTASDPNSTITVKYKSTVNNDRTWRGRWLVVLRYANL